MFLPQRAIVTDSQCSCSSRQICLPLHVHATPLSSSQLDSSFSIIPSNVHLFPHVRKQIFTATHALSTPSSCRRRARTASPSTKLFIGRNLGLCDQPARCARHNRSIRQRPTTHATPSSKIIRRRLHRWLRRRGCGGRRGVGPGVATPDIGAAAERGEGNSGCGGCCWSRGGLGLGEVEDG